MKNVCIFLVTSLVLVFAFCSNAYAYIDPGSGSMLLQMLIAMVAGTFFYFRKSIKRFITQLKGNRKRDS